MGKSRKSVIVLMSLALTLMAFLLCGGIAFADEGEPAEEPVYVGAGEFPTGLIGLPGAEMQLLDKDGNVLEEWTSTAQGHEVSSQLILGETYTVHEVTPPSGHHVSYDIYDYDVNYCLGYDTDFTIVNEGGKERIDWSYYRHAIDKSEGGIHHGSTGATSARNVVGVSSPRSRTLEFGKEILGSTADPDEYFEVILDIPEGVPGQVMNVDLSNADASKNPSEIVIPESGSLKASFWLKDGQSIKIDGFPLMFGDYYSLYENNETMNEEAYITHILANETINQLEADELLIQGIGLIGKAEDKPSLQKDKANWFAPLIAYAGTEIVQDAYSVMNEYAAEELFNAENPVVDPAKAGSPVLMETFGLNVSAGNAPFTISDTLTDGTATTRSASKRGRIPGRAGTMLVDNNGVYGDGYVLFINRRGGVKIQKTDEDGEALAGSELQILSSTGDTVHSFTSTADDTMLIALRPGEYKLHEVKAPDGYLEAEDVDFTVVDSETVQIDGSTVDSVKMIDKKKPEEPAGQTTTSDDPTSNGSKSGSTDPASGDSGSTSAGKTKSDSTAKTGDDAHMLAWCLLLIASGAALTVLPALTRRRQGETSR